MESSLDLDKIEKKTWSSFFQDGLFDIFFALMFIISGVGQLYDHVLISFSILFCVVVFVGGKYFITKPRLGVVKFGRKRMEKQLKAQLALLAAFLCTLVIFLIGTAGTSGIKIDFSYILIILFIVIFGSLAYFMDFPRFLLYGIMFAVGEYTIRNHGDIAGAYILFTFGSILLVIGLYHLSRFMKNNPIPEMEVTNG